MKVTYVSKKNETTLRDIEIGAIFRPTNSRRLFMKCDLNGGHRCLANDTTDLWDLVSLIGAKGEVFDSQTEFEGSYDWEQLIFCVEVGTGTTLLLFEGVEVELLNCELLVDEA